jgi:G3E family GTPase
VSGRIPLHVLTGFLGSGKTTLLNRVLRDPAWADSAILINEIGAVSIDHHLVDRITQSDNADIVVLKGGCTCCALRGDMVAALRELYARRADGRVPPFARVVMETTGLADPAPIAFTLAADVALRHKFERGIIVATLDAVHGFAQLDRHPEARKQIAVADRIVVTKSDLDAANTRACLTDAICSLNPAAAILDASDAVTPQELLAASERLFDGTYEIHKSGHGAQFSGGVNWPEKSCADDILDGRKTKIAESLSDRRPRLEQSVFVADAPQAEHSADIASVAIRLEDAVPWSAFAVWLSLLIHAHGEKLLRFKALLDVAGWPGPVALDAIHHMVHPPRHLAAWPDGPRHSRLVFIAQGLDVRRIEPSLRSFLRGNFAAKASSVR